MPDYSKNFDTLMTGHVNPGIQPQSGYIPQRTNLDNYADIRDLLSAIVGAGKTGLGSDQEAVFARLGSILGNDQAQKLINHALIFNQRPDVLKKTPEQRVDQFYNMGSNDASLNDIIQRTKMFGQGPVAGLRQTPNDLTQKVGSGTSTGSAVASTNNIGALQKSSGL